MKNCYASRYFHIRALFLGSLLMGSAIQGAEEYTFEDLNELKKALTYFRKAFEADKQDPKWPKEVKGYTFKKAKYTQIRKYTPEQLEKA